MNNESECASDYMPTRNISDIEDRGDLLFLSNLKSESSEPSLVPEEWKKIARKEAMRRVPKDKAFIVKWIHDLVNGLKFPDSIDAHAQVEERNASTVNAHTEPSSKIRRNFGQESFPLIYDSNDDILPPTRVDSIIFHQAKIKKGDSTQIVDRTSPKASTSKQPDQEDSLKLKRPSNYITHDKKKKSILKTAIGVQTVKGKNSKQGFHVQIAEKEIIETKDDSMPDEDEKETTEKENLKEVDKETQTKEKQD